MTEQETIDYWVNKINVEQEKEHKLLKEQQDERMRTHALKTGIDIKVQGLIISKEMHAAAEIPVADYDIIRKHGVQLTGYWWCKSGRNMYEDARKMTIMEGSNFAVASGTPIVGFYKIVGTDQYDNFLCYYNSESGNEFVSEPISIHKYQLFAPVSHGNKNTLSEGDIFEVQNIELVNNKYAVTWVAL